MAERLFSRSSWLEYSRTAGILRAETTGGLLLIGGAILALIAANSGLQDAYTDLAGFVVGPAALHLDLSLSTWAADGLLAIFFFVAGLELKREFVAGDLRDPSRAALPVIAAIGGMAVPALIFVAFNGPDRGWAVPTATDIAFAVAVLAVAGSHLPTGLRTFLLTLAVVDDLLAITVIAFFYTEELDLVMLALAALPVVAFAVLVRRGKAPALVLLVLAFTAWALVHASGVHATVAGVALAFTVKVAGDSDTGRLEAERLEHLIRPISAGFAVPVFAFFAAGVNVGSFSDFTHALTEPIALGVMVGLLAGKMIGITGSTFLLARFTKAKLDDDLSWIDVIGMSAIAGIGFTVSLLIGELAYGADDPNTETAKVGILVGSVVSALVGILILRIRNRVYRRIEEQERIDSDADGIPDVYEKD
ncbi:MAG: Na+/H+ antiporter NhaA [Nocardioides sp.]